MSQAPASLLATTGATTSLARQVGFAFGPALATVAWGLSSYRLDGMTAPLLLATACSAVSVIALLYLGSTPWPRPCAPPSTPSKRSSHA